MHIFVLILGGIAVLLGGLWLLQGMALLTIPPILCVAACEPIEGGSGAWAAIGLAMIFIGALAITYVLKRRAQADPSRRL